MKKFIGVDLVKILKLRKRFLNVGDLERPKPNPYFDKLMKLYNCFEYEVCGVCCQRIDESQFGVYMEDGLVICNSCGS